MLAVEIAQYLDDLTVVTFSLTAAGGNTRIGSMPTTPDIAAGIWPTGGPESSTKTGYDERHLQVRTRSDLDLRTGYDLGINIYNVLHGMEYTTLPGGTLVVYCAGIQSEPVSIGEDDSGRHEYTLNYRFEVRNPTTNRQE